MIDMKLIRSSSAGIIVLAMAISSAHASIYDANPTPDKVAECPQLDRSPDGAATET